MAGKKRYKEFKDFPKYEFNYKKAFEKMIAKRIEKGLIVGDLWSTADKVFDWWMEKKDVPGQITWNGL